MDILLIAAETDVGAVAQPHALGDVSGLSNRLPCRLVVPGTKSASWPFQQPDSITPYNQGLTPRLISAPEKLYRGLFEPFALYPGRPYS
jgi:hypothetical protein